MNKTIVFTRTFFLIISLIFMVIYAVGSEEAPTVFTYVKGTLLGVLMGATLIGCDLLFKRYHLRSFNIIMLGLFIGYLMALAILLIFNAILSLTSAEPQHGVIDIIRLFIFLFGTYLGVITTLRSSETLYISIPYVKCNPTTRQTKEIFIDRSALDDPRLFDLASSGLLDESLVLPRFLVRELQAQLESADENARAKSQYSLETINKLEGISHLQLRYNETDFPEIDNASEKVLRLARLYDADIIDAESNGLVKPNNEGIRFINLHTLSDALKPVIPKGKYLKIKIQRSGKEELQGVGYLEDGTMVVVNGGGGYIGETIRTRVLSAKHTSFGRIVFCNVAEDEDESWYQ